MIFIYVLNEGRPMFATFENFLLFSGSEILEKLKQMLNFLKAIIKMVKYKK